MTVVVVGAGLAGLACARVLHDAGLDVVVRERGRVVGGRLASQRLDGRPVDLGAAYFTVSDPAFASVVDGWQRAGLARPWTKTFKVYGGSTPTTATGPQRWAAPGGLRSLAEHLATGLPVRLESPVTSVTEQSAGRARRRGVWTTGRASGLTGRRRIKPREPADSGERPTVDGEPVDAVALCMPGPQAERIVPGLFAPQPWAPVFSAVLRYPARGWPDFHGAFVNDHPVLATVCDDGDRRGDDAPVLVAHTTDAFARPRLADPASAGNTVAGAVASAVGELMNIREPPGRIHVHRWTYARPEAPREDSFELAGRVGLAGDVFGTPRAQTAWLSGRALGVHLATLLS